MKLTDTITQVTKWDTLTPEELLTALNKKDRLYVNLKKFNLIDVARVIGAANMNNFIEAVQAAGHNWMIQQATSDFTPGDEFQNAELLKINNVYARQLATHTRRMVNLIELYQLPAPTIQEVSQAQFDVKLQHEKQQKADDADDKVMVYKENLSKWDGNPLTEPKL